MNAWRSPWPSGVAALALLVGLALWLRPVQPGVLALQFAFTPGAFGDIVHRWSPEQLQRFRAHLPVDCVLLLCYGRFGHLLSTRTAVFDTWPRAVRPALAAMLPLAAGCDAAENALHWWLTAAPRFGVPLPYRVAAVCASLKWLLLVAFALAVALALAAPARPQPAPREPENL